MSLWPGLVQTEMVKEFMAKEDTPEDPLFKKVGKGRGGETEQRQLSSLESSDNCKQGLGWQSVCNPPLTRQGRGDLWDFKANLTEVWASQGYIVRLIKRERVVVPTYQVLPRADRHRLSTQHITSFNPLKQLIAPFYRQ